MPRKKVGIIIVPPGVFVEKHEKLTVDFLAVHLNYDVTFLAPNRHKNNRSPDILINDLGWEIKSPKGKGFTSYRKYTQNRAKAVSVYYSRLASNGWAGAYKKAPSGN